VVPIASLWCPSYTLAMGNPNAASATYDPRDPWIHRFVEAMPESLRGFFFLAGCLTTLIFGLFLLPFIPLVVWLRRRRQRWFIDHLKKHKRVISWPQFLEKARDVPGSVIVEIGNNAETRFWWVEERVMSLAPIPPVPFSQVNIIVYGGGKFTPFARWCYERYLSPVDGIAVLASPVEADFETFPFSETYAEEMRNRFPKQDVVIVSFYDARYV